MSAITLDQEIALDRQVANVDSAIAGRARSHRPAKAQSMLWGPDEAGERERFDQIQRRLIRLEAALFEDSGTRIDRNSWDCVQRLFIGYPTVRAPSISAQPDGVLIATWRKGARSELAVKCVSRSLIHFAMVVPLIDGTSGVDRTWGPCHTPQLFLIENAQARRIAG